MQYIDNLRSYFVLVVQCHTDYRASQQEVDRDWGCFLKQQNDTQQFSLKSTLFCLFCYTKEWKNLIIPKKNSVYYIKVLILQAVGTLDKTNEWLFHPLLLTTNISAVSKTGITSPSIVNLFSSSSEEQERMLVHIFMCFTRVWLSVVVCIISSKSRPTSF